MAEQEHFQQSVLHKKCQDYLKYAFSKLDVSIDEIYCSNLATLVLQSMVGPSRFFHTFRHVLEVGMDTDPIEMLAGVFHDLIIRTGTGISFNLTPFLSLVVQEINGGIMLRNQLSPALHIHWLLELFGFEPGQPLSPKQGQNEFLSAVVAVRLLESLLPIRDRLAIAVCIEATIPFRMSEGSHRMPEVTLVRLRDICQKQGWAIPEDELVEMVRRSVRIANRDVLSFAQPSAAGFLADIWNLLPENNHELSPGGLYRIRDYRNAIAKTEAFFRPLNPHSIFRQFRGEPSPKVYQQWQTLAEKNLIVGRLYLSCKLVAIALLEALSEPLGNQTTMELFMGTLPNPNGGPILRLEQFLPPPHWSQGSLSRIEQEVWQLLSEGRAVSSHKADLVYSPLATFVVQCHGFKSIPKQRRMAKAWLSGSRTSKDFLRQFDPQCLTVVYEAISRLWEQRQQLFRSHFSASMRATSTASVEYEPNQTAQQLPSLSNPIA